MRAAVREFRLEEVTLGVEHFELGEEPVLIADSGKPKRVGEGRCARGFGIECLACAQLRGERLPHLAERLLQGLLVLGQRLALAGLYALDLGKQASALEDGLRQPERERPDGRRTREKIAQRRAFAPEHTRQRDPREQCRARRRDAGVGGDQALLRFDNVRAPQQQIGRQALRHHRRLRLTLFRATRDAVVHDGPGTASYEHRQRCLLRGPIRFQRGKLGLRGGDLRLELAQIEIID